MAKKRTAKLRGDAEPGFVIRENKTKGYLTQLEGQGQSLQPVKSIARQFATEDEAKEVAAVALVNNYTIEAA